MGADPRKRQKKLQKKASKRKEKKKTLARSEQTALLSRLEVAGTSPVLHSWFSTAVLKHGYGLGNLSRVLPNGDVAFCPMTLDAFCLGVKEVEVFIRTRTEYEDEYHRDIRADISCEDVSPAKFRKYVESLAAWSESLGLQQPPEYRLVKLLFGDIDASECAEEFTFGRNGTPLLIVGADDNPATIGQIRDTLIRNVGEENFRVLVLDGAGTIAEWDNYEEDINMSWRERKEENE